jgi:ferrochelatase
MGSSLKDTVILLVNLGTPSAPNAKAVGRYLREFLSDTRVVEIPSIFWKPLLYGVIVPIRSKKSAKNYASIWMEEGSPLAVYHHLFAQALQSALDQQHVEASVLPVMRYAERTPDSPHLHLGDALRRCEQEKVKRVVVVPMFPQSCGATTGSIYDFVFQFFYRKRQIPSLDFISDFSAESFYIDSLKQHIENQWKTAMGKPDFLHGDCLVMSFHGMPKRTQRLGDPYFDACVHTSETLAKALGLQRGQFYMTFQSRFGPEKWLSPTTDDMLKWLAKQGKRVDVVCPAFVADCVETLEEIAQESRHVFLSSGGREFNYLSCLNAEPLWVDSFSQFLLSRLPVDTKEPVTH